MKKVMLTLTILFILLGDSMGESRSFSRSIRWYRKDYLIYDGRFHKDFTQNT